LTEKSFETREPCTDEFFLFFRISPFRFHPKKTFAFPNVDGYVSYFGPILPSSLWQKVFLAARKPDDMIVGLA